MLDRITPLHDVETLPLVRCFGRIAARDIVSPLNVPGFDNAAMDGYAVRLAICKRVSRCRWQVKRLPGSRSTVSGQRAPACVL
ncbi:hypothetical protein ACVXG7_07255 [Enterobacter hormaechei]